MAEQIQVRIPYDPRPLQAEIHQSLANNGNRIRFGVFAIHRRFGKTVCAIAECINIVLTCPHLNPRVYYVCPTFKQAKSVAWEYVKDMTRVIPGMKFLETDLVAKFPNGGRFQLVGGENFDTMRGNFFDLVIFDEYGNINPQAWREVVRPALADRLGSVLILGTPNGKNHFFDIYEFAKDHPDWLARTYRADETNILPQSELDSARETMGEEEYRQEFLCDWQAAVRGSYYALESQRLRDEGRFCSVPHAQILPVDVSFDLGMDDATAVWFVQCVGQEVRLIDYREWRNTSIQDILLDLSRMKYIYGTAVLPHDAQVRELTTGRTRVETFEESSLFQSVEVVPKLRIADGVNAVRQIFPQMFIDSTNCATGLDCLENYRKVFDQKTGEYKDTPVHDKYSHGADSMRYLATYYHPQMGEARDRALGRHNMNHNKTRLQRTTKVRRTNSLH